MEMKSANELNFLNWVCRSCCKSLGPPTDLLDLTFILWNFVYFLCFCVLRTQVARGWNAFMENKRDVKETQILIHWWERWWRSFAPAKI